MIKEEKAVRKNLKRNIVVAAVLVFVGSAVYLNWSYNSKWGQADAAMAAREDAAMEAAQQEYLSVAAPVEQEDAVSAYFAQARLTRQQSRDEALALLEMTCAQQTVSQEVIDESMRQISSMAQWNMAEAVMENELLARNFADCVVFASADGVTVAVPAPEEGLTETAVAQITETVLSNSDFSAGELNIIEIKE